MFKFNYSSELKDEARKEAQYINLSNILKIKTHTTILNPCIILFFSYEYSNFFLNKKRNIDLKMCYIILYIYDTIAIIIMKQ